MEKDFNIVNLWKLLFKWNVTIVTVVFFATLSSVVVSLLIPKIYKAEATLMAIQQKSGGLDSALAQIGGGFFGNMGRGSSTAQLLAVLRSRTFAENIIEKYKLMEIFFPGPKRATMEDAVQVFASQGVSFTEDKKSQLIVVKAMMRSPQLAADVANGCIEELNDYLQKNTFTVAKKNRIFIEEQLERSKAELLEAGKELAIFYTTNNISNVVSTVNVAVGEGNQLDGVSVPRDEIGRDPDKLHRVIAELEDKITKAKVVKDVPQQIYLSYLKLRRDLLTQSNILLTQQYETAKIEEVKENLTFQVIDHARVPIRKYKPERTKIVITGFIFSLLLTALYVFFREYLATRPVR